MTSQQKKAKLQRKADKLYQEIGRKLNNKCLICSGEYSCLHHYFPKSTCSALRYNLDNGIPICSKCHCRIHSSDDPTINNRIRDIKGEEWLRELEDIKKNTFVKTNIKYYEAIINELREYE